MEPSYLETILLGKVKSMQCLQIPYGSVITGKDQLSMLVNDKLTRRKNPANWRSLNLSTCADSSTNIIHPTPANSTTMHSRLVRQERDFFLANQPILRKINMSHKVFIGL